MKQTTYKTNIGGRDVEVQLGKYCGQASGHCIVRCGDTVVMVNATMNKEPRPGQDFFPLSVDYEEKLYTIGKIPGGFKKREGRPSDVAILKSRLIDRPLRPLFPKGFYNDVLFHRVINQFMIQTGDPESKGAPAGKSLGSGGPGYDIDAEIVYPQYFHKRGALAAARQGDEVNPDRRSSGSQFYIVTGKVYNAGQLGQMEKQLQYQQMQTIFNDLAKQHRDSIMNMRRNRDQAGLQALQEELVKKTEAEAAKNPMTFTDAQREAYTTVGGTPHLDGTYTVFGEVVEGMDVVAKIETTATGSMDRPKEDIKIISMTIVK